MRFVKDAYAPAIRIGLFALMSLLSPTSEAQGTYTLNPLNSTPPVALTPGQPTGSYQLTAFESINVHNGRLGIALPLLEVGGRGEAGYTMTLAIGSKAWSADVAVAFERGENAWNYYYTTGVRAPSMTTLFDVGYGPGNLALM